jgi:phosphoenolpyruvate synthase/pyruvate phosphate dikinase
MEKETIKSTWSLEKAQEFAIDKFRSKQEEGTVTWELILEVLKIGVLTGHKFGAKWQAERMYSENEVLQLLLRLQQTESYDNLYGWFEQVKKQ